MSYGYSKSYFDDQSCQFNPIKRLYKGILQYFKQKSAEEEIPWNSPLRVYPPRWTESKATSTPVRRPRAVIYKETLPRVPIRRSRKSPRSYVEEDPFIDYDRYGNITKKSPIRVIRSPRTTCVRTARPIITNDSYSYYGRPVAVSTPSKKSYYLPRPVMYVNRRY